MQEASVGTGEGTRNISGVDHAATQTGASAHEVLSLAANLKQQTERVSGLVGDFLQGVRRA